MGKIKQILENLKESPKDVADIITRGSMLLILYFIIVGVIILALARIPIEGPIASLLFAVVGYMFGLFTPRPFGKAEK